MSRVALRAQRQPPIPLGKATLAAAHTYESERFSVVNWQLNKLEMVYTLLYPMCQIHTANGQLKDCLSGCAWWQTETL